MLLVEAKSLLRTLNRHCTHALEAAIGACIGRGHYEITVEHMLAALMEDAQSDVAMILQFYGVDAAMLKRRVDRTIDSLRGGNPGKPVFSPLLLEWIQDAQLLGSVEYQQTSVRSGTLLVRLVQAPERYTASTYPELENISKEDLLKKFTSITTGSSEEVASEVGPRAAPGKPGAAPQPGAEGTALARFCINFTEQARGNKIDPVFGRDREIRQVIDVLARRRKNNPIIVGEAGVGKTALVEGLALRVVEGDVPDVLRGVEILGLDLGLLQAGAGVKGEFENRLKAVIDEVKGSPKPIILFIDEAHTMIGAGGAAGGSDAANLLKPALARGELRTMAATTWSEYKKYFEKDPALTRRFQLIKVEEPDDAVAATMLRGLRERYESSHGVRIRDDAVVAAARLASRYISGRQHPDKGVDLLDTCAARVKIALKTKPDRMEQLERRIAELERHLQSARRDQAAGIAQDAEALADIEKEIASARTEVAQVETRWKNELSRAEKVLLLREELEKTPAEQKDTRTQLEKDLQEALAELEAARGESALVPVEVDPSVVAGVISDWTGIPVGSMLKDEAKTLLELERRLGERIRGQDHAIRTMCEIIRSSKLGLGNPESPLGVFLLVGPSGVGKTETALGIADLLFGGERFVVTINMSEFQEKHTVSRLIGSPPGYVGYGEGGVLTEAVRQRPYSAVILDEVEKADLEVMNLFYQVFDKGMLSDGEGRVIDFKNTVLLLTSNLATDVITSMCEGGARRPDMAEVLDAIRPVLSKHFKPALLARMTVVPYYPISPDAMRDIVELKLGRLGRRISATHKIRIDVDPAVVDTIAQRCTEVESGARNVDHILRRSLLPEISRAMLERMAEGPLPGSLTIGVADGQFAIRFPQNGEAAPLSAAAAGGAQTGSPTAGPVV